MPLIYDITTYDCDRDRDDGDADDDNDKDLVIAVVMVMVFCRARGTCSELSTSQTCLLVVFANSPHGILEPLSSNAPVSYE